MELLHKKISCFSCQNKAAVKESSRTDVCNIHIQISLMLNLLFQLENANVKYETEGNWCTRHYKSGIKATRLLQYLRSEWMECRSTVHRSLSKYAEKSWSVFCNFGPKKYVTHGRASWNSLFKIVKSLNVCDPHTYFHCFYCNDLYKKSNSGPKTKTIWLSWFS